MFNTINTTIPYWLLSLASFFILNSACTPQKDQPLRVAVASNARFVVEEIAKIYTEESGQEVELIASSSGKLTAQILEGAPYDLFLSADIDYPTTLYKKGKTTDKPVTYAIGTLGLWATREDMNIGLQDLNNNIISRIACANPETAPYGKAAIEALQSAGIYGGVRDRLIFGESVGQVSQFLYSKAADVGFVPSSLSKILEDKVTGHWVPIDNSLYKPIQQGVVLIDNQRSIHAAAKQFYQFLFTEKSRAILRTYGYQTD